MDKLLPVKLSINEDLRKYFFVRFKCTKQENVVNFIQIECCEAVV
jgi:hypothetical protein